jgi:hypothetical protein
MTRTDHPKVTNDEARNVVLVAAYGDAPDTGPAFTEHIRSLGYASPARSDVLRWGCCVIYDDEGAEWLAWDAEEVADPVASPR